jgi:hypothetical protein
MSLTDETLQRYLAVHNECVAAGDFRPLVALFTQEADLRFVGIEFGPFAGHEQITQAFRDRPPLHKLVLSSITVDRDKATAIYATAQAPDTRAGTLVMTTEGERIQRLTISVIKRASDNA